MSIIRKLAPLTANQIAAGEVVERPYSVVKELVENSIDAGATEITVEIRGGGSEYIRVVDNGGGIPADQLQLAFERHSTSKITVSDDLFHIDTLGFRGEALASIAAVSKVTVRTCTTVSDIGALIRMSGDDVLEAAPCGCPKGSVFTVEDLFFNVPARLKFMKSPRSESAYVADYIARMILANPSISIRLINGEKTAYQSSGNGSLSDACAAVYGQDILQSLMPVAFDDGYIRISGFIGRESIARANRNQQTVIVNGRYIKEPKISFTVQRAYDMRLMIGRFPFYVLDYSISSRETDVNVHPKKLEIRFRDEDRVLRTTYSAVKSAFAISDMPAAEPSDETPVEGSSFSRSADSYRPISRSFFTDSDVFAKPSNETYRVADGGAAFIPIASGAADRVPVFRVPPQSTRFISESGGNMQTAFAAPDSIIVGSIFDTYWIIQAGDSIYVIDQHAAHERVLYQRYFNSLSAASQKLLVPDVVHLSPEDMDIVTDNMQLFSQLGYELDSDGIDSVTVTAAPVVIMGKTEGHRYLFDAIDMLMAAGKTSTVELKRSCIIQAACKHAVKADDKLSREEIRALIDEFSDGSVPLTCPHGRPVAIRFSRRDIEKEFGRIQ